MHSDAASSNSTPLPLRNDTILGVCEAIGRDLGFNPTWLRIAFAGLLFADPVAVVVAYLGLGLVVGFAHWLLPDAKPATVGSVAAPAQAPRLPEAANQPEPESALSVAA